MTASLAVVASNTLDAHGVASAWQQLRVHPLRPRLWLELAQHYSTWNFQWPAAFAARQHLHLLPGATAAVDALSLQLKPFEGGEDPAVVAERCGHDPASWQRQLRDWLQCCPDDWLSALCLARSLSEPELFSHAECIEPIAGETRHLLGRWCLQAGDAKQAVAMLRPLIDQQPPRYGSMLHLGEALLRLGRHKAAEGAFTRASASPNPAFLRYMAERVYRQNYWQEAIGVLQRALEIEPDSAPSLLALARLYSDVFDISNAERCCQQLLLSDPGNAEVHYLLNALAGRSGDAAAHLAAVEAHYKQLADPTSRLASSIAMASLYVDHLQPAQLAEKHRSLCAPIEQALAATACFANSKDPQRSLRIGLVTSDLHRQHPVNLFMLPLLERLDPKAYPVTVFHTGSMHDDYTSRAQKAASNWIESASLSDPELKRRICDHQIDILLDLGGHTSNHRLGVFAMRAAPVQVAFLGYPHSTGLSRMDWLIGDAVVSPAEHASLFSEGIAQLPGSVFCWSPVDHYPLPPPRPAEAPLVFGSFNNVMKLSPRTIALWSGVLRSFPQAQLVLKAPSLRDASVLARFQQLFVEQGITADRLHFEGPEGLDQMMQRYGAIDIALDPTPYNGGTTTLQALWMGVPVLTLAGGNFVSRMGASFLTTLGRSEWIAADQQQLIAIAARLVADLPALRLGRAALREQMAASGLSDPDRYSKAFEALLRRIWCNHCSNDLGRLLPAEE